MFNVKEENTEESLLECIEMGAKAQYEEIISKSSKIKMGLDKQLMSKLVKANILNLVVARDLDGKCIGYFCNLVDTDWLTSTKIAKELAIFVDPAYRKSGVYNAMLKLQEELMLFRGVGVQMLEFQMGHNDKLPLSNGYSPVSINYEKHLGEK